LFARDDDRITFVGATILVGIALAAGIASFAILQGRVQTLVSDDVLAALRNRTEMFRDLIELREVNARIAATRPAVMRNLRVIHAGRDDGSNIANVEAVVDSFIKQGFTALAYYDVDGKVVASGGNAAQTPELAVTLATPDKADLLWHGGFLLRHRIQMFDAAGKAGMMLAEQPLPVLTRLQQDVSGMGATGDMGLCVLREERLHCFPQRLNPQVFSVPLVNIAGESLPATRALRGETGTVITRDYRAQNVVAAYGPVGDLGLGMVVKVDAAEIFLPIREQLLLTLGLLLLLVAGGTLLLRSQVKPLATELMRSAGALRENEERFRMVLSGVRDYAIIMLDTRGHVTSWNAGAEYIKGYRKDEIVGQHFSRFYIPEDLERGKPNLALEAVVTEGRFEDEGWRVRKDGSRFWASVVISALHDGAGKSRGFVKFTRDITSRKEAEEVLTRRTAELEAANDELEAFSYSVSHDLRAPLRHIDGFSDMLREECAAALTDSGRRHLGVISESVKQMGKLIDDLLAFSKMGRVEMRRARIDMNDLVKEVLQELAGEINGRNIEWDVRLLSDVWGDRSMLKQVWVNLLSNAVKYTRARDVAKIKIECSKKNGDLEFRVQDNGAGFDMKYAEKLFGVFQRLHKAEEFEGTGVGLANVRRVVTRHGGRAWALAKVDEGSIFYFTLPVSERN
jgi:PAS domain S-box-containing protein